MGKYDLKIKGKKVTSTEGHGDIIQILFILNRIASELAENNRILRSMHNYGKKRDRLRDEA